MNSTPNSKKCLRLCGGQGGVWNFPPLEYFLTLLYFFPTWVRAESLHLYPTLCNPMNCSPPRSSIFQARILEWVAISFSWGSSWPRDRTHISCLAGGFFTTEPPGKPKEANSGSWLQSISSHCWLCFRLCGEHSQPLGGITDSMDKSSSKLQEMVKDREA